MFLLTLLPKILEKFTQIFLKYYFLFISIVAIYIEIATYPFFAQYDVRPNFLFVEYLVYPKEVFNMIIADYKLALFIAFVIIVSFAYLFLSKANHSLKEVFKTSYVKRLLLFIPLLIVLFIGIRSSLGHRAANISDAMFSENRIINELTKNSIYSIGYAIYSNKKHNVKDIAKRYGKIELDEAIKRVQNRLAIEEADEKYFLTRFEKSHFSKKKNLVIFIQESLGYQFVQAVGGEKGITPHFNTLAKEGILFKELYSNGTRSVRGIAGLVAGNFSVPGKGVIKRNKSQKDYFTIASLLKPLGYHTSFIYGGESRFDNMKGWFLGNGFDEVIDEEKFNNPEFVGTWGVSDGDVVNRAIKEYKNHYKNNQKFASVIFSTSNHSPFDFPENKIKLIDGVPVKSVKNAIKYADFAIGDFIRQAKNEPFYKDTVFVIAADHNVRVYGDDIIPVDMFQIPGLILGSDINVLNYTQLTSQADVLATALDLIGVNGKYPIMGQSIFKDNKNHINLMQFNDRYALRVKDKVAIAVPNKKIETFIYKNKHLTKTDEDIELQNDLLAFIHVLNHMYQNRLYR
jgi:phosphoglycerol transferase MdoB-like AlkP superfamily enzyme